MRVRAGIRAWLLLLILTPTIPLLGVSAYSAYRYAQTHRLEIEADLVRRTDTLAVATRDRLAKTLGTLNGLAVSDAAQTGDITALYSSARRVQERDPDIAAITLIAADDKTHFITLHPLGEEIPTSDLATVREVFATG